MKHYKLNGEIYVVRGAAKCCIYDIGHNKLFSVDKQVADTIEHAVLGHDCELNRAILNTLLANDIVVPSDESMVAMPVQPLSAVSSTVSVESLASTAAGR